MCQLGANNLIVDNAFRCVRIALQNVTGTQELPCQIFTMHTYEIVADTETYIARESQICGKIGIVDIPYDRAAYKRTDV